MLMSGWIGLRPRNDFYVMLSRTMAILWCQWWQRPHDIDITIHFLMVRMAEVMNDIKDNVNIKKHQLNIMAVTAYHDQVFQHILRTVTKQDCHPHCIVQASMLQNAKNWFLILLVTFHLKSTKQLCKFLLGTSQFTQADTTCAHWVQFGY